MKLNPVRCLPVVLAIVAFFTGIVSRAADPLVFVSSFAAGTNGAIEAFRLDSKTGRLTHLHRAAANPPRSTCTPNRGWIST